MTKIVYGRRNPFRTGACTPEDIDNNFRHLAELYDVLGRPGLQRRDDTPLNQSPGSAHPDAEEDGESDDEGTYDPARPAANDVEPSRAWVRFTLTGTFGGSPSVATANILGEAGSVLSPNQSITVTDVMGRYGTAAGTESGYANIWNDARGNQFFEVASLGGLTSGSGVDDFKVKVEAAGDTQEYLDTKLENTNPSSSPAFNASNDQLVNFDVIDAGGPGPYTVKAYTTKLAADGKFKVSSADTADYFVNQIDETGDWASAPAYNSSIHQVVWPDWVSGGAFVDKFRFYTETPAALANDHKVKIDGNDLTERYLDAALVTQSGTYGDGSNYDLVQSEIVGADGTDKTLRLFVDKPTFESDAIAASRVTLTAPLKATDTSGSATLDDDGDRAVTVLDPRAAWYGKTGWQGLAVCLEAPDGASSTWQIAYMEQYHQFVRATATVAAGVISSVSGVTQWGDGLHTKDVTTADATFNTISGYITSGDIVTFSLTGVDADVNAIFEPVAVIPKYAPRVAAITTTIAGRSGTTVSRQINANLYEVVGTTLTTTGGTEDVFNLSELPIIGTVGSPKYVPVMAVGNEYVIANVDISMLEDFDNTAEKHLATCEADPKWHADAPVTDLRLGTTTVEILVCGDWEDSLLPHTACPTS